MAVVLISTFVLALALAMAWDLTTLEIPDTVPIVLCVVFLLGALASGTGWDRLLLHLGAGILVFGIGLALFAANLWGGGDVKLAAAIGLWLGLDGLFSWLLVVAISGGFVALGVLLLRRMPLDRLGRCPVWLQRLHRPDRGIPYGIALGIGGLASLDRVAALFGAAAA